MSYMHINERKLTELKSETEVKLAMVEKRISDARVLEVMRISETEKRIHELEAKAESALVKAKAEIEAQVMNAERKLFETEKIILEKQLETEKRFQGLHTTLGFGFHGNKHQDNDKGQ